jgi:hypothetical protein
MHLRGGGGPLRPPYSPCEVDQPEIHKPNPREKQDFNLFKSIFEKKTQNFSNHWNNLRIKYEKIN